MFRSRPPVRNHSEDITSKDIAAEFRKAAQRKSKLFYVTIVGGENSHKDKVLALTLTSTQREEMAKGVLISVTIPKNNYHYAFEIFYAAQMKNETILKNDIILACVQNEEEVKKYQDMVDAKNEEKPLLLFVVAEEYKDTFSSSALIILDANDTEKPFYAKVVERIEHLADLKLERRCLTM